MAAHQAPPSLGFSRQEYWSGVPSPSSYYYFILSPLSSDHQCTLPVLILSWRWLLFYWENKTRQKTNGEDSHAVNTTYSFLSCFDGWTISAPTWPTFPLRAKSHPLFHRRILFQQFSPLSCISNISLYWIILIKKKTTLMLPFPPP